MNNNSLSSIIEVLEKSIHEESENNITWWNIIKDGFDVEVDRLRWLKTDSKNWLDSYRTTLIEETGISNIKIKYTNIAGYFIEVSKSQIDKILDSFVLKQTLVNASRYVTKELIDFEKEISSSEAKLAQREYEIFQDIRDLVLQWENTIRHTSTKTWELDVITWLSTLASKRRYVKPKIVNNYSLKIVWGRHPVIETMWDDFISNNLELSKKTFSHIITWPNMGGKSTFLRQNALIILLAHVWSYVPANEAIIPITDKIFSRIWASDNLFLWQSTFMVEMQEIANILNNATKDSFVIIDEVWRGTSTYDGMSLAWAILKENHDHIKAKTLFSTHYHELCDEAGWLPGVENFSVAVGESSENIVFLRKIIPGSINKSYGLEVAKLAWIGEWVIEESEKMLKKLQWTHTQLSLDTFRLSETLEKNNITSILDEKIRTLEIDNMTPMQALWKLKELQDHIR